MPDLHDIRLARPDSEPSLFQVTAGAAALRETPAPDGRLGTQVLHGEVLSVFREQGEFGLAQCARDNYVGWVNLDALSAPALPVTHKVRALRTYCLAEPHLKAAPRCLLSLGARVTATGRADGAWVECARAGWIYGPHLTAPGDWESDPVHVAERFLEAPYLWGGRESLGLDCSGLVQQAFEACGILLPRDSDMQAAWAGEAVPDWSSPGALRRGDLVFWDGHVGLLSAPDTLLHANAFHMAVAREPFAAAAGRIEQSVGGIRCVRRVAGSPGAVPAWLARFL